VSISAFTRQDGSTAPMTLAEKCHVQQLVLRETPARKMKRADGTICYDLDFQGCPMFEIHFNGDATKVDVDQLGELLQNAIAKVPRVADLKLYVRIIEAPIYEGFARKTVLMQETDIRTQKITLNFLRTFKDLLPKVPQEMIDGLGQINTLLKPGYVPGGVPEDYLSFPF